MKYGRESERRESINLLNESGEFNLDGLMEDCLRMKKYNIMKKLLVSTTTYSKRNYYLQKMLDAIKADNKKEGL